MPVDMELYKAEIQLYIISIYLKLQLHLRSQGSHW